MIGRDDARRQLEESVAAARGGQPACVLVSGEAGMGKTRLVSEAASGLDADCILVTGFGVDLAAGEVPLLLLSSSVRSLVQRYGLDAVRGWAAHDASRLATLVRELDPHSSRAHEPLELIEAFRGMLARVSAARFVWWAVEDLQWADVSSTDAVRFVVQLMQPPERLLVTCTLRSQDRPDAGVTGALVSELIRAPATQRIRLGPLGPDQVRVQVASLREDDVSAALAERVMVLSDGVPFLVEELVAGGLTEAGPLPASASELMVSRLSSFGADAEAVVHAASVAEDRLHDRWLGLVTGLSPTSLDAALTRLLAGGILDIDDTFEGYRFHHALMREAVGEAMLPTERSRWHRRWAEALSSVATDEFDASTMVEVAQHWIRSGSSDRAFVSSLAAARAADVVGAQRERGAMLCEALRLWTSLSATVRAEHDRDDLIEQAVWACSLGGRAELGIAMLTAQMKIPDTSGSRDLRRLRLTLAKDKFERTLGRGQAPGDRARLEDQVALLRRSSRSLLYAHAVSELMANSVDVDSSRMLDELVPDALQVVTEVGTLFDRVDLLDSLSHHVKVLGRLEEAADLLLGILRDHGDRLLLIDLMRVESNAVSHLFDIGRFTEGAVIGRQGIGRLSNPRLCPEPWSALAENLAATLIETGDWTEAKIYIDQVDALGVDSPAASNAALAGVLLECRRGDLAAADDHLASIAQEEHALSQARDYDLRCTLVSAEVALSGGDARAAWALLAPLWRASSGHDLLARRAQVLAARTLGAATRGAGVPTWAAPLDGHVRDLREAAGKLPSGVWLPGWRIHFEAELARCLGEDTRAQWEDCVNESERMGQPYEQGLALLGMAYRALEHHETPAARDALERAQDLAVGLGSMTLIGWVREAAGRGRIKLDDTPASSSRTTGHGLTQRELEVLGLVAEGYSNDEIGATLFISSKTVSVHVSHVLSKLGVKSRGAASALAHREGLLERWGSGPGRA